jgi:hypothetical protein
MADGGYMHFLGLATKVVAFGGPILLALMGVYVIDRPPKDRRKVWIWAFLGVATASTIALIVDSVSTEARLAQVWEHLTGGDNYCFMRADEPDLKAHKEKIRWWIEATGPLGRVPFWIHLASSIGDPNNPDYWKFQNEGAAGVWEFNSKGGGLVGRVMPIGGYRIELNAPNGLLVEYLNIFEFNGELVQTIDVLRDGKAIYSSPRP